MLTKSAAEVHAAVQQARHEQKSVGVVMTMGALHAGHLSLVEAANARCDFVIVTIFVNPTQFGPHEDFEAYPRSLEADLQALSSLDVDLVFVPTPMEIYPEGCSTSVAPPAVAAPLEGTCRPQHFIGVCTVVLKLLNITQPDEAFFGKKDYQQYLVIRDMVRDLNLTAKIVPCETQRDPDGLAMSSRNAYLTADERHTALAIPQALAAAARRVDASETSPELITQAMLDCLEHPSINLDYAVVVDADTLQPITTIDGPVLVAIAARVGSTRLIDNRLLQP
ncbi:MAG: pantoate--beta-alanine ligase [Planctomycetota bacterium]